MDKVYIFGHRFPDTDSVTSAIALEHLKRVQGFNAEARVIGEINDETKYILDRFNIKHPVYLNDVRLQMKDIMYHKGIFKDESSSIMDIYNYMGSNNTTGVPIVDHLGKFKYIVTAKMILNAVIDTENNVLDTNYENILNAINGTRLLQFDNEIKGEVNAVSYKSTTFIENFNFNNDDILIVGDRYSVIEKAISMKIKLLILTGNCEMKEEHMNMAIDNKVNIIRTPLNTFKTVKKIMLSNYIKTINSGRRNYTIMESDYYDDFLEDTKELGFNNYPVIDKNGFCKGLYRITDIRHKNKKKVILVDHNESAQSVQGLDEADILEVIDHHKIGDISTNNPINFRNMTVGSCNTIIYKMYEEARINIPPDIASLMLGGIISDTLALSSPTTTDIDKVVVKELEKISGLNYKEYAHDIFNSSVNLENKTEHELLTQDIKTFINNNKTFKVSQIITTNANNILKRKDKLLSELEEIRIDGDCDFVILMITDILKNGSYILFTDNTYTHNLLSRGLEEEVSEGMFLEGFLSRKKQVVPLLLEN